MDNVSKLNLLQLKLFIADSYNENQCIDNCIEKRLQSLECIPNPFTTEMLVPIDSNQISNRVCNKSINITINDTIDVELCVKECPKHCSKKFRKLTLKASHKTFTGDSYLIIKNSQAKMFSYQAEENHSLIQYVADLGGLFGLYLGISFIEIGTLINHLVSFLKRLLNTCMNMEIFRIMTRIKRNIHNLILLLTNIEQINFKIVSKLIFPPMFIYQLFIMIDSYFKYSTETNYEFIPYNITDNKYSVNEFPSITVCNELLLDKIWFDNYSESDLFQNINTEVYWLNDKLNEYCQHYSPFIDYIVKNITNKQVKFSIFNYIAKYLNYFGYILPNSYDDNEEIFCKKILPMLNFLVYKLMANDRDEFKRTIVRINDKYSNGLNETQQLLDFYGQHYSCATNMPSFHCSDLSPIFGLLSPHGKCHTFLYNHDKHQRHAKSIDIRLNIFLDDQGFRLLSYPYYLSNRIILQDKSAPPSEESIEIIPFSNYEHYANDMAIELKKTLIKRLQEPYETRCHDYGDSNMDICMNECYMKKYRDKFNCLPNHNKYHTIFMNSIDKNNSNGERKLFCPEQIINNIIILEKHIRQYCEGLCASPCLETYYQANIGK